MMEALAAAVKFAASFGASGLVINGVSKLVPANSHRIVKAVYMAGAIGLAGAAGDVAEKYWDKQFRAVKAASDAAKEVLKEELAEEKEGDTAVIDIPEDKKEENKEETTNA